MSAITRPTSASVPAAPNLGRARRVGLVVVAVAIAALFGLPALPGLVTAWSSGPAQGGHLIHLLAQGTHGLIIVVAAFTMLRDAWRRPAAVHLLFVAVLFAVVVAAAIDMLDSPAVAVLPIGLLVGLVAFTPDRRALVTIRPSLPLLTLATLGAGALGVFALDAIRLQATLPAHEPHAVVEHWAGMAIFAVTLAALALVTALRPIGWRLLLWTTGAVAAIWGVTSAAFPRLPSSLGVGWGVALAGGGALFVALGRRGSRRDGA